MTGDEKTRQSRELVRELVKLVSRLQALNEQPPDGTGSLHIDPSKELEP